MADEQKKIFPIDYTKREFGGIREELMEIAELISEIGKTTDVWIPTCSFLSMLIK